MLKLKLIEDRKACDYTRCGRTDKGVSALGQIVSCRVRSAIPKGDDRHDGSDEAGSKAETGGEFITSSAAAVAPTVTMVKEMDYCTMLNNVLPADIRVLGWTTVSPHFNARFSATSRTYRYFFIRKRLNISAMRQAASLLVGSHDFRNFCKIDPVNVSNFVREIFSAQILPFSKSPMAVRLVDGGEENEEEEVWMLELCGVAFLWHMVRCIMSVLFLVGRGEESPAIFTDMFDVETVCSSKPVYIMASEEPLVLYKCGFKNLHIPFQPKSLWNLSSHFRSIYETHMIAAARALNALKYIEGAEVQEEGVEELLLFLNSRVNKKQRRALSNGVASTSSTFMTAVRNNNSGQQDLKEESNSASNSKVHQKDTNVEEQHQTKRAKLSNDFDDSTSSSSSSLERSSKSSGRTTTWAQALTRIHSILTDHNANDYALQPSVYVPLLQVRSVSLFRAI